MVTKIPTITITDTTEATTTSPSPKKLSPKSVFWIIVLTSVIASAITGFRSLLWSTIKAAIFSEIFLEMVLCLGINLVAFAVLGTITLGMMRIVKEEREAWQRYRDLELGGDSNQSAEKMDEEKEEKGEKEDDEKMLKYFSLTV